MWFSDFINNYVDVLWWLLHPSSQSGSSDSLAGKPASPIPVNDSDTYPPLFALVIGINHYKNTEVTTLKGAAADADSVKEYLENVLKVPQSHIRNLRNAQATRTAIIAEFCALETNTDIKPGDPILIYYAGHGGEVIPPADWEAGGADSKTQMLIPHDYRTKVDGREVYGIPDRTIGVLINRIAKAKRDNITVIFDCCYSGSGTRTDETKPTHLYRGFTIPGIIPADLDQNIWGTSDGSRGMHIPPGFLHCGLRSHILLAACGAKEKAKEENGRGFFTKAFLDVLKTVGADKITYTELVKRIHALPEQNPQCEGANQGRILFNAKAPSTGRVCYIVCKQSDKYVLDAGAAHGITDGAEFAVYENREWLAKTPPLGILVVEEARPFATTMCLPDNAPPLTLSGMGYALQIKAGEEEDLRLHIELDDKLSPVFEALARDLLRTGADRRKISLVEKSKAELDIALENSSVVFNIFNTQVTQFGLNRLPFQVKPTYDDVYPVIWSAAHYHWHLRRNNKSKLLQNHIQLEFNKLEERGEFDDDFNPIMEPVGENLNVAGVVDIVVDADDMYGIKIVNHSALDLYPCLFFFDSSDLSITSYYQPPIALKKLDVPLPAKKGKGEPGSLTIGYGCGGAVPFSYFMREGQDLDVGFLKLFLTTEPVDYSNIPQFSPFSLDNRATREAKLKPRLIWDTILIAVVQRRTPLVA